MLIYKRTVFLSDKTILSSDMADAVKDDRNRAVAHDGEMHAPSQKAALGGPHWKALQVFERLCRRPYFYWPLN